MNANVDLLLHFLIYLSLGKKKNKSVSLLLLGPVSQYLFHYCIYSGSKDIYRIGSLGVICASFGI